MRIDLLGSGYPIQYLVNQFEAASYDWLSLNRRSRCTFAQITPRGGAASDNVSVRTGPATRAARL